MPWKFKTSIPAGADLQQIYERRVSEGNAFFRSERARQVAAQNFRNARIPTLLPSFSGGAPLGSRGFTEVLRDLRMTVALYRQTLRSYRRSLLSLRAETNAALLDIQREVSSLSSLVLAEEFRHFEDYEIVHVNNFSKREDMLASDPTFKVDPKTNITFPARQFIGESFRDGITLPERYRVEILPNSSYVVRESSSAGDSHRAIVETPAKYAILPDKHFRYVIIKRDYDETGRLYSDTGVNLKLSFEFGTPQLINLLELRPLGQRAFTVEQIAGVNDRGEEIIRVPQATRAGEDMNLHFAPMRVKRVTLTLRQDAPVARGAFQIENPGVTVLNEYFSSLGFTNQIPNPTEEVQGRVYDFSLKQIHFYNIAYDSLGFFESSPLEVVDAVGLGMHLDAWKAGVTNEYGDTVADLPILAEPYVAFGSEVIPVPSGQTRESEALALVGDEARLRFFPDLQNLSFEVFKGTTSLVLGTDYLVSLDGGNTWISSFPTGPAARKLEAKARAFSCLVKLVDARYADKYWVRYKLLPNQLLAPGSGTRLSHGKLVMREPVSGSVRGIIVLRSENHEGYTTPVVRHYVLKVDTL